MPNLLLFPFVEVAATAEGTALVVRLSADVGVRSTPTRSGSNCHTSAAKASSIAFVSWSFLLAILEIREDLADGTRVN